jgi:hypothetical protein
MALGLLLVVPVPPSPELEYAHVPVHAHAQPHVHTRPEVHRTNSATRLLAGRSSVDGDAELDEEARGSVDLDPTAQTRSRSRSLARAQALGKELLHPGELADVPSHDLWKYADFWLLFAIMSLRTCRML